MGVPVFIKKSQIDATKVLPQVSSARRLRPRAVPSEKARSVMSHTGHVKWFDRKKGIGFVTPVEGGEDVFIHRRNFAKDAATGKQFVVDEGDEIYFNLGSHEDRVTAIEISLPIGTEKKPPRRNRGRAAKKELDEEAVQAAEEEASESAQVQNGGFAAATAPDGNAGGGRDSKTHRRGVRCRASPASARVPTLCLHLIWCCPLTCNLSLHRSGAG